MRLVQLASIVLLLAGPAETLARPWNGVNPGATTAAEVEQRFGEPTKRTKSATGMVLAYFGEKMQNVEGVKQLQFHVDAAGVVQVITVFLAVPLDPESVEGTYGKPTQKTFTDTTFQKVWVFATQGVTAYWTQDGTAVEALSYSRTKGAAKAEPAKAELSRPDARPEATGAKADAKTDAKGK